MSDTLDVPHHGCIDYCSLLYPRLPLGLLVSPPYSPLSMAFLTLLTYSEAQARKPWYQGGNDKTGLSPDTQPGARIPWVSKVTMAVYLCLLFRVPTLHRE